MVLEDGGTKNHFTLERAPELRNLKHKAPHVLHLSDALEFNYLGGKMMENQYPS